MIRAIKAEFLKVKGSKVPLWTALAVVAYGLVAIAGAFGMKATDLNETLSTAGGSWAIAAGRGWYSPTWENVLRQNVQGIAGAWGVLLFGFVTAYVFGRERKEGTDATMLTSPVHRRSFAVAKTVVVAVWVLALTLLAFLFQTAGFALAGLEGFAWGHVFGSLGETLQAAALIYLTLPLVAFFALTGKPRYLRPMLFLVVAWVLGNTVATTDYAHLYPWMMPVLIGGASWLPVPSDRLDLASWVVALGVFVFGLALTMWKIGRSNDAVAGRE